MTNRMYYKKLKTWNSNLKISHENKIYTENNRANKRKIQNE